MQDVQTAELARLDELLEELGQASESQCELLREHLESARIYLVGSMPAEYALTLRLAGEAANCITDRNLRARVEEFVKAPRKNL
jgi:hypothetical protein